MVQKLKCRKEVKEIMNTIFTAKSKISEEELLAQIAEPLQERLELWVLNCHPIVRHSGTHHHEREDHDRDDIRCRPHHRDDDDQPVCHPRPVNCVSVCPTIWQPIPNRCDIDDWCFVRRCWGE